MPPSFVLDQNYPTNIIDALGCIPEAQLTPLRQVDRGLTKDTEDWEILRELRTRGYDGFVTNDDSMMELAKELAVLIETKLTLVVVQGVGHDPIRSTGLLLTHLAHIAKQTTDTAQLWVLRPPPRRDPDELWARFRKVCARQGEDPNAVLRRERNST